MNALCRLIKEINQFVAQRNQLVDGQSWHPDEFTRPGISMAMAFALLTFLCYCCRRCFAIIFFIIITVAMLHVLSAKLDECCVVRIAETDQLYTSEEYVITVYSPFLPF